MRGRRMAWLGRTACALGRRAHALGRIACALGLGLVASGCSLVGPRTIDVGRVHYNDVIQRTSNEQMLLNLVRLRYSDTPFFLQVASVSTAFEFKTASSLGISISPSEYLVGSALELAEQPTITYTPLQGEQFVKSVLTPVDPANLLLLYHSGWAVDRLLRVVVQRLGDVQNATSASGPTPKLAPEYEDFLAVAELLRGFQTRGEMTLSARSDGSGLWLQLDRSVLGTPAHRELATRLGVDPTLDRYALVPHTGRRQKDEVPLVTRSLMAGLFYVSQGVEVPAEDEAAGRVTVTRTASGERFDWRFVKHELFRVLQAESEPEDASIRTHYRDHWFYLADADLESEATFALLMQLFSLQSGNAASAGPVLTLPVGR